MNNMITVDGSFGEGGGQILRSALFLSALRVALANGGTAVVAGLLLASGLVHLLCLWRGYVAMIDRN